MIFKKIEKAEDVKVGEKFLLGTDFVFTITEVFLDEDRFTAVGDPIGVYNICLSQSLPLEVIVDDSTQPNN